jgi:hypothetical protein
MGLVFIAIIALPVIIMSRSGKQQKKALMQRYQAICSNLGLHIVQPDKWNDLVVGLDQNARKLLYYKDSLTGGQYILLDLNQVLSARKINIGRNGNTNSGAVNVIDMLGIEVALKNGQSPVTLEFYHSKQSFNLSNELELVDKWTKAILEMSKR